MFATVRAAKICDCLRVSGEERERRATNFDSIYTSGTSLFVLFSNDNEWISMLK